MPDTPLVRVEAALALFPERPAYASHRGAGRVYGVPLPPDGEEHVTLLDQRRRPACAGLRIHRTTEAAAATALSYPEIRVIIEYDGRPHFTGR